MSIRSGQSQRYANSIKDLYPPETSPPPDQSHLPPITIAPPEIPDDLAEAGFYLLVRWQTHQVVRGDPIKRSRLVPLDPPVLRYLLISWPWSCVAAASTMEQAVADARNILSFRQWDNERRARERVKLRSC